MLDIILRSILAIWLSYSVRTPKLTPNPMDYEYAYGIDGTKYKIEQVFERENGKRYFSQDLYIGRIGGDYSGGEFEWLLNGARGIDTQEIVYSRGKALRYSATLSYLHWTNPTVMLGAEYKNKYLSIGVKTDFHSRSRFYYRAGKKFFLNDMLYLLPETRLTSITGSLPEYQAKLSVGINLK